MPDASPSPLVRTAPAKLNLGLHVVRRRADGYHDLETVFLPIGWHDTLAAVPATGLSLVVDGADLPADGSNLVVRAARALAEAVGRDVDAPGQGAALRLDKRIPFGAGLGGGSSDAAATLRLLAAVWDVRLPEPDLHALAARLGADVPVFLDGVPAYAEGIGDVLAPLVDDAGAPYVCPFSLVVVAPDVHVSTAEAYRLVTPREARADPPAAVDLRAVVLSNDLGRWRRGLLNDFEAPVVAAHPALAAVRAALEDAGAGYAAMSGSGSAFFGAFDDPAAALGAAEGLRRAGHRVWHGGPA